jgi:hypothetical protein
MTKFKNPLTINENDTVGTALWKGVTEGYIKSSLGVIAGLGIAGVVVFGLKRDSKETKKVIDLTDEEVDKAMSL